MLGVVQLLTSLVAQICSVPLHLTNLVFMGREYTWTLLAAFCPPLAFTAPSTSKCRTLWARPCENEH
jgi:hypothetical protein